MHLIPVGIIINEHPPVLPTGPLADTLLKNELKKHFQSCIHTEHCQYHNSLSCNKQDIINKNVISYNQVYFFPSVKTSEVLKPIKKSVSL